MPVTEDLTHNHIITAENQVLIGMILNQIKVVTLTKVKILMKSMLMLEESINT